MTPLYLTHCQMNSIRTTAILISMSILATCWSCQKGNDSSTPQPIIPDVELTTDEKANGVLTPEILWKFGRIASQSLSPDGSTLAYAVTRFSMEANRGASSVFVIPTQGGEPTELTSYDTNSHSPKWSPDGRRVGFISNRSGSAQLWEIEPNGQGLRQVTDVPDGISAFWYSPTGKQLLFARRVQVEKTPADLHPDMHKANLLIADDLMYRHWGSWSDGKYSHLFVADLNGQLVKDGTDIMEGEPWDAPMAPFFSDSEVAWSPCGGIVAYTCKKLKGLDYALSTNSDIYLYHVEGGTTRNITEGMPGYDKYPTFSPNGEYIAWQSMETPGYESDKHRLMVMELATGSIKYLTQGFDQNADNIEWLGNSELLFISGVKAREQVYSVALAGGTPKQITQGDHNYTWIATANGVTVGNRMSISRANELFTISPDGIQTQITDVNGSIYEHIQMGDVQERWVRTTDGKEMLVWVILPPNFDPARKYPCILYCQGGPQSTVSQFWSYRWNFQLMAAQGYIVVAPNRRGVPSFGQEWNAQISGDYSGQNIKDYISAIDDVKREPWVDSTRLGAVGASYGGYSAFYLAGVHQGRFKAFISHNGVFNLESFYGATEETFFPNHDLGGAYWETANPTAQRSYANSPHKLVQNWDTPILVIVGEKDFRVPYTEGLQAFNAARLRGIPSRLLVFPDEDHWILKPQNAIVWHREFFGWLNRWLK